MPRTCVQETKSGVVVEPGDYKSLAESIIYLEQNKDVSKELGENGRQYVENDLSIEIIGLKMKEILEIFR